MNAGAARAASPARLSAANPFPGLRPYGFDDAPYYFGREDQILALYRLLEFSRFIAVVGSSGSGKSSLVRAGLLPLLARENEDEGGRQWRWIEMRPGTTPLRALAAALARAGADDPADPELDPGLHERLAYMLRESSFGLVNAIGEVATLRGRAMVVVVDQFEELFRYARAPARDEAERLERARAEDEAAHFSQLLLEASRYPDRDIHVLITMRSDFIGDCARFHGLPEAVSASQFLTPSLARDQREEAIVRPVTDAGASIDPGLVERILNEAGDDLDQLPVLQHCLKRLWERAGQRVSAAAGGEAPAARRLTLEDYDAIGRIVGALSQHAEEVLASLPGLELAVEQVFRALAEFDRDGRTIRRARRFGRLVAETGVGQAELRTVVDRFRAADCSFLVPPPSDVPALRKDTVVDVGHEALLRKWERISADILPGAGRARPRRGWLRAEEEDGRAYRTLLALAEVDGLLPLDRVEERLAWWKARPRTAAWADRYGGHLDRVRKVLADSRKALSAEKTRAREEEAERVRQTRRLRWTAAAFGVLFAIAAIGGAVGWTFYNRAQEARAQLDETFDQVQTALRNVTLEQQKTAAALKTASDEQEKTAAALKLVEESSQITSDFAATVVGVVQQEFGAGRISAAAVRKITQDTARMLERIAPFSSLPVFNRLQVNLLLTTSDALIQLGDKAETLDLLRRAARLAETAAEADPEDRATKQNLTATYTRLALALLDGGDRAGALDAFRRGDAIDRTLPDADPVNLLNLADLTLRDDPEAALALYREVLAKRESLYEADPIDERRAHLSASWRRIGLAEARAGRPDAALAALDNAMRITGELIARDPTNNVWQSNFSAIARSLGDILLAEGKVDEALAFYARVLELRKALAAKDDGNVLWQNWLALAHRYYGDALLASDRAAEAAASYEAANAIWTALVARDADDPNWPRSLADIRNRAANALLKAGEASAAGGNAAGAIEAFRQAVAEYERNAAGGDDAASRGLVAARSKLGAALQENGDIDGAVAALKGANQAAETLLAANPGDAELAAAIAANRQRIETACAGAATTVLACIQ